MTQVDAALDAFHAAVADHAAPEDWAGIIDNDREHEQIEGNSRAIVVALLAAGWRPPDTVP